MNIELTLSKEIEYTDEFSKLKKTNKLYLFPFNIKSHRDETIKIRQLFYSSLGGLKSSNYSVNEEEKEEVKNSSLNPFSTENIVMMLTMSTSIDTSEFYKKMINFLTNDIVFLDENKKVKLTTDLIDDLELNDLDLLVGEYIANFFIFSWMKNNMKN